MKKILFLGLLTCLSMAVHADQKGVSVSKSGFDGTTEVVLKPYGSSSCLSMKQTCISVGAMWTSAAPELVGLDLFALRDLVIMSKLHINIDGQIIEAQRVDQAGSLSTVQMYKESRQRFAISKADFEKILAAQKVWLKINRTDGSYIETYLINDGKDTLAQKGLLRFSTEIH